jgi:hypothetical protein
MTGLEVLFMVLVINACVLGAAFFTVYQFNKAVSQSGR